MRVMSDRGHPEGFLEVVTCNRGDFKWGFRDSRACMKDVVSSENIILYTRG